MTDRFNIGRALAGALTSPLPVRHGKRVKPGLRVMLGNPFGLGTGGVGKAPDEHLGYLAMELLPRARQQRLIGYFLDEDVLKGIERRRE